MADIANIIYLLETRDRTKDKGGRRSTDKAATTHTYTVFDVVLKIIELIEGSGAIVPQCAKPYIVALQKHFGFETPEEASLLAVYMNLFDDCRIHIRDIAKVYGVKPLAIINCTDAINDLIKRQIIIRRRDNDGESTYRMTEAVVEQLRKGILPKAKNVANLSPVDFCTEIESLLVRYRHNEMEADMMNEALFTLMSENKKLHMVQCINKLDLGFYNLILLLVFVVAYINRRDDEMTSSDIDDYFDSTDLRRQTYLLENGHHDLILEHVIEHSCVDGQIDNTTWKLTEEFKENIFQELNLKTVTTNEELMSYGDITAKKMFYNPRVTKEVKLLESLFKPRRMSQVLRRLEENGMRKGFTCIFYGGPGTGKTETVMQLARMTKRDIMLVDVPSIRSKWVGDTEKNVKRIFTSYRRVVKENPNHAPILLFNEADALLCKRNKGGKSGVDKMENAMQNIILQEMENLEGIMIATTNLAGNLDAAFERRFLYKVEFDKPTAAERLHIWKAMLKGLTKDQAMELAKRYDFSGGQIENISRKRIVNDIITGRETLDMKSVIESCNSELLNKRCIKRRIGFN